MMTGRFGRLSDVDRAEMHGMFRGKRGTLQEVIDSIHRRVAELYLGGDDAGASALRALHGELKNSKEPLDKLVLSFDVEKASEREVDKKDRRRDEQRLKNPSPHRHGPRQGTHPAKGSI